MMKRVAGSPAFAVGSGAGEPSTDPVTMRPAADRMEGTMPFNRLRQSFQAAAYRRRFLANRDENLFDGSYANFADARAHVPSSALVGYDHAPAKQMYSHQIAFYDYPAMFWLGRCLHEGMRNVLDIGGHVGIKYYAFRRALDFPADLRWTVFDVPTVVEAGRELAGSRQAAAQLSFVTDLADGDPCDVFFASGSLQYLSAELPELIDALAEKPKRVILNTTAAHPTTTLYTLNSIGFAICPYRIKHHDALLAELVALGYRRRDGWYNEGKAIRVPFVEHGDAAQYVGCCYDLASTSADHDR